MQGAGRARVVPFFDWHRAGRARAEGRAAGREQLVARIPSVHEEPDGAYGADRVHAELARRGVVVARRTVAETMADEGIVGISGRERSTTTTRRDRLARAVP
ncbi:MAG: IS3 family transposase [Acidimicrobiia bacterium]|nr:IS3 family transposase [Acidimicrobiia bacterium]